MIGEALDRCDRWRVAVGNATDDKPGCRGVHWRLAGESATSREPSLESVCVWMARLDVEEPMRVADLTAMLSRGERARAARYRGARDRGRFVVRRVNATSRTWSLARRRAAADPLRVRAGGQAISAGAIVRPFGQIQSRSLRRTCGVRLRTSDARLALTSSACTSTVISPMWRNVASPHASEQCSLRFPRRPAPPRSIAVGLARRRTSRRSDPGWRQSCTTSTWLSPQMNPRLCFGVGWQPSEPTRWRMEALDVPAGYIGALVVGRPSPG